MNRNNTGEQVTGMKNLYSVDLEEKVQIKLTEEERIDAPLY